MEMTQVNTVIFKLQKSASRAFWRDNVGVKRQLPEGRVFINLIKKTRNKWGGDLNLVLNLEIEHLSQLAINEVNYRWN